MDFHNQSLDFSSINAFMDRFNSKAQKCPMFMRFGSYIIKSGSRLLRLPPLHFTFYIFTITSHNTFLFRHKVVCICIASSIDKAFTDTSFNVEPPSQGPGPAQSRGNWEVAVLQLFCNLVTAEQEKDSYLSCRPGLAHFRSKDSKEEGEQG